MKHLQLYRNATPFNTREDALNKLADSQFIATLADGEFITARYKEGDETYVMTGHYVESIGKVVVHDIALLESEIDTISGKVDELSSEVSANTTNINANTTEIVKLNTKIDAISGGITGDFTQLVEDINTVSGQVQSKQDELIAGEGIAINDNEISCTLDTSLYLVVTSLPTTGEANKIYLIKSTESGDTQNIYIEYAYVNSAWEKLGEYKTEIDLTPYLTKTEATNTYLTQTNAESTYAKKEDIPTKLGELTNDKGFITLDEVPKTDLSEYAKITDIETINETIEENELVTTAAIAAIKESCGLGENLEYTPGENFISGATSVSDALNILSNSLKDSELTFTKDDTHNVTFTKTGNTIMANVDTYDCGEY